MRSVAAERRAKPAELRGTKPRERAIPPKDSKESKRTRCKAGFRALLQTVSFLFLSFSRVLDQNLPRLLFRHLLNLPHGGKLNLPREKCV